MKQLSIQTLSRRRPYEKRPVWGLVVSIWLFIFAALAFAQQSATSFPSATELTPIIRATVSGGSLASTIRYSYTATNSQQSIQEIAVWALLYDATLAPTIVATPNGWISHVATTGYPMIRWGAMKDFPPGSSDSGFDIEAQSLPGIVQVLVGGLIPFDQLPAFPEGAAPADLPGSSILDNSVQILSVGPVPIPQTLEPIAFLNSIIDSKERAFSLGWIHNAGILKSLDAKLNAARESLRRGQIHTARNQLRAVLHEVDAQEGKHLTPEAVGLLKFNVQFLLANM